VVVLSYLYSGAQQVQDILAAGPDLACTAGTGILPLCGAAARAWQQIEDRSDPLLSRLAVSSIRALIATQITAILAGTGKDRWCELAIAAPATAQVFAQVCPQAAFVCVHRGCADVIQAAVQASQWGLAGQGLTPYLISYPGNSVATMAACWADSTEELLAFEKANPATTHRVHYEVVASSPATVLAALRPRLGLTEPQASTLPGQSGQPESPSPVPASTTGVPAEMIPLPLRQRINRLSAELGYTPLPAPHPVPVRTS
jgi:Sulfotransferase family